MKRYRSTEWNFAIDIPKHWHSFPPISSNSPFEVIRFSSKEDGTHLVIVFRAPHDPKQTLKQVCDEAQKRLAAQNFGHFTTSETKIGSRPALVLEFDRPHPSGRWLWRAKPSEKDTGTWSCREYFLAEGTLQYTLGFGTTNKDAMFELYDRIAKSFEFSAE